MVRLSAQARRVRRETAAVLTAVGAPNAPHLAALLEKKAFLHDREGEYRSAVSAGKAAAQRMFRHEGIVGQSSHSIEDLLVASDAIQMDRDVARALRVLGLVRPDFENYDFWSPAEMTAAENAFRKEFGKLVRTAALKKLSRL